MLKISSVWLKKDVLPSIVLNNTRKESHYLFKASATLEILFDPTTQLLHLRDLSYDHNQCIPVCNVRNFDLA